MLGITTDKDDVRGLMVREENPELTLISLQGVCTKVDEAEMFLIANQFRYGDRS